MTTSTSAITRELFQLKEQIDQLTFKLQRCSPMQKDQLKMRLEGLRRTQRGLKHIRTLMLNASSASTNLTTTTTSTSTTEDNKPSTVTTVEPQNVSEERRVGGGGGEILSQTQPSQQGGGIHQMLSLSGKGGALLGDQVQRLRLVLYYHLKRYKPLQILKAAVALWFLATFILRT